MDTKQQLTMEPPVRVKDKYFQKYITKEEIEAKVIELCNGLKERYEGKEPVFLGILNGAFMFAADVFKHLEFDCEITFVKMSSYVGTESTGKVNTLLGLDGSLKGREVIILEDIIDTGTTLSHFIPLLQAEEPASIALATLLLKPDALRHKLPIDFVAFEIPNKFVIGYGLDYDGFGRNYKDIYQLAV